MSGAALPTSAVTGAPSPHPADGLFRDLVVSDPSRPHGGASWRLSLAGHTLGAVLLLLIPILWPQRPPESPDYVRALLYNPPPPPPPPLPKGSALLQKPEPAKPVTPEQKPDPERLTTPLEKPEETPLRPEARTPDTEQAGSPTGSDIGVPEGMEVGVEGGVVGGIPGGVLGGVVGGTGDGPVLDYDQPPRLIKQVRPQYPPEAFIKKIEGEVYLQILIDSTGRVVSARVVRSVPLLDAAAVQCVKQWVFAPAVKLGRPVATIADAPVTFRIY